MLFLCPSCRTPLPAPAPGGGAVVTCTSCSADVDLSRAGTAAGRPRFVPEPDRAGMTVGGYRIDQRIGAGGMGTVYRATREGDSTKAALKFLAPELAAEPAIVARFRREVAMLGKLDHPGIVRVLGSGEQDGAPWFAMELVEGEDLRSRLRRGPLDRGEVQQVFGRIFDALEHAHQHGIVHRDLKPANVLLSEGGTRLADFGVAAPDAELRGGATRLTETAAVIGTLAYMSPEQRAGREVDRRSDLFSTGVMLYEAITGRLPQGAFAPPSQLAPGLPRRIDALVMALLQPEPDDRPTHAADAARWLRTALGRRPRGRLALEATAALLLAGGLTGGGAYLALRPATPAPVVEKQEAAVVKEAPGAKRAPVTKQAASGDTQALQGEKVSQPQQSIGLGDFGTVGKAGPSKSAAKPRSKTAGMAKGPKGGEAAELDPATRDLVERLRAKGIPDVQIESKLGIRLPPPGSPGAAQSAPPKQLLIKEPDKKPSLPSKSKMAPKPKSSSAFDEEPFKS